MGLKIVTDEQLEELADVIRYRKDDINGEGLEFPNGMKRAILEILPGGEGKSAYQIAVENGFVGTEEEWLESLVGPQGPRGESGVYVGDGEVPDDCNVQVIPNGEGELRVVKYTTQSLTEEQKTTARYNIGAGSVSEVNAIVTNSVNSALTDAKNSGEFRGDSGITPHIGNDGYWYIGSISTNIKAEGTDGNNWYSLEYDSGDSWSESYFNKDDLISYMVGPQDIFNPKINDFLYFIPNNIIGMITEIIEQEYYTELKVTRIATIPSKVDITSIITDTSNLYPIPQIEISRNHIRQFPFSMYTMFTNVSNQYENNRELDFILTIDTIKITLSDDTEITLSTGSEYLTTYFSAGDSSLSTNLNAVSKPIIIDLTNLMNDNPDKSITNILVNGWCVMEYGMHALDVLVNNIPSHLTELMASQSNLPTSIVETTVSYTIAVRDDLGNAGVPIPSGHSKAGISNLSISCDGSNNGTDTIDMCICAKTIYNTYLPIFQFVNGRYGKIKREDIIIPNPPIEVLQNEYVDNMDVSWDISTDNATRVIIKFGIFNTEHSWDKLYIYDNNWNMIAELSGTHTGEEISASSDNGYDLSTLRFQFTSDGSVSGNSDGYEGFKVEEIIAYYD